VSPFLGHDFLLVYFFLFLRFVVQFQIYPIILLITVSVTHMRETGEVIPSGWHPGKMVLTPEPYPVGQTWEKRKLEMGFD
jgi:hypothetical protein